MLLTSLFVVAGTVLGLIRALPQLGRLVRTRDARGVSVDTAATSSVVSFAWAAYGAATDHLAVALASGASALMFAIVTLAALRFGRQARELRMAPVWLVALLASGAVAGAGGLGLLLPVSVLVANVPQLLVAWRERDLSALSLGTWALSVVEALVWGTYGFVVEDGSILVHATLHLFTSGGIVALRLIKTRRERRPKPAEFVPSSVLRDHA